MASALLTRWLAPLGDLLFPAVCPVCEARADGEGPRPFCAPCWARLPLLDPPLCPVCGRPIAGLPEGVSCGACRHAPPPFAFARGVAAYRDGMRAAIHAFKYGRRVALAPPLGRLLAEAGLRILPGAPAALADALVPVPLHPGRLSERGFNQAELLAEVCAEAWRLPCWPRALVRARPTRPQAELNAAARRANVAGAFQVGQPARVDGRRLLLVDDVLTTGATVRAAAGALARAGAAAVGVLVLARVADP